MRKSRMKFIALSLLSAITITGIIPSVAMAEELQVSEETKQEFAQKLEDGVVALQNTEVKTPENASTEDAISEESPETDKKEATQSTQTDVSVEAKAVSAPTSVEGLEEVLEEENVEKSEFDSKSLIVNSKAEITFTNELIKTVTRYDEYYILTFETVEDTKAVYDELINSGVAVEINTSITKPDDVKESELDKVEAESEDVEKTTEDKTKKTITVAVLDTGIADVSDDELLKGMVLYGYSVIGDDVYDNNGHGTVMANVIANTFKDTELNSNTEIKILPIKVLDENGNGSVLSVYMGMEYALEHDVDVINLSLSGVGNSNILTNEINKAYNQGITTVVAAGNNSDDVAKYIPGNIDAALTISAVTDRDNEKVFAEYSNHGSFVDFSAMGTYEMIYTKDDKEVVTKVDGTSVSSAYVTSYVALLKALATDELSETDVYGSLKSSAVDLGDESFDEYFGNGYLDKNNIKEISEHKTDDEKVVEDIDIEENLEDANQKISISDNWSITYNLSDLQINGIGGYNEGLGIDGLLKNHNGAYYILHVVPEYKSARLYRYYYGRNFAEYKDIWDIDGIWMDIVSYEDTIGAARFISMVYSGDNIKSINIKMCNANLKVCVNKSANIRWNESIDLNGGTFLNNIPNSMGVVKYNDGTFWSGGSQCMFFMDKRREGDLVFDPSIPSCVYKAYRATFDGNGRKLYTDSCNANCVYVADGMMFEGMFCTFKNGKTSAVLSNNTAGTQFGESRVGLYWCGFENCVQGLSANNRIEIDTCSFNNCVSAINIHSDEKDGYGSSGIINNCTITSDRNSEVCRGIVFSPLSTIEPCGIEIKGSSTRNEPSVIISNCNIKQTQGTGIKCHNLAFDGRTVKIENTNVHDCSTGIEVNDSKAKVNINENSNIDNNFTGILNKAGITTINGGTIKENNQDGIKNGEKYSNAKGTLIINSGLIENNGRNGIYNEHGKAQINGGTNRGNKQYGYRNESELIYAAGDCGDNSFYDVYQNGDYEMSGDAKAYSNGVYLTPGHTINITSPLTCEDGAIKVTIEENSRNGFSNIQVGRQVAYCSYGMNKNNADAMLRKFVLLNTRTATKTSYVMKNGYKNRVAALRSGNGINGAVGNIILSEEYYVSFDKNINNSKVTADVPGVQTHYWKEDAWVPCGEVNLYYNGKKFNSLVHNGWNKSASFNSDGCGVNGWLVYPAGEMTSDKVVYAIYTGGLIDLSINGNNQTAGDNYTLYNFENNNSLLPENTFERKYEEMVYDVNLEHDELSRRIYSHEGWHLSDNATYKDNPYGYNQKVDFTGLIYDQLNSDTALVGEDGNVNITIYSVWDEPPVITAKNWWISTKQVDDGIFTDENILKRVNATDKEDGTNLKLEVVYPVSKDYYYTLGRTGVWKKGKATVTIVATDSRGNETRKLMYVGVHKDGMIESSWADESKGELPRYVRSISRKFYDMKDTDAGLGKYSVWYVVPTYKKTILDAFYRLENDQPIMIYEFNCADIRSSQEHCFSAIRNETWLTKEHYDECVEMYKDNKIYDSGYRSSQALCSNRNMNWYKDKEIPEEWFDYSNGITDANLQGWVGYYKATNPSFSELQYIEE